MIELRKAYTKSRSDCLRLLYGLFSYASAHIGSDTFKILVTGNPNAGKMLVALTAFAGLSDDHDLEELLKDLDEALRVDYGRTPITINGIEKPFVFKHDSLQRLKPHFPDLREQARGGVMIVTAITDDRYTSLQGVPKYEKAFQGGVEEFDCMIDMRTDPSRLSMGVDRLLRSDQYLRVSHDKANKVLRRLNTIEMNAGRETANRLLDDVKFKERLWNYSERAL